MFTNRLARAAAVAFAIAAAAAPAASARPIAGPADYRLPPDFQTADRVQPPGQDLRPPDTRDYAEGRGTYNAPDVVVVEAPAPAAEPSAGGIDWADVGLGAGSLLGLTLIAAGGAVFVVHRRGARQLAG